MKNASFLTEVITTTLLKVAQITTSGVIQKITVVSNSKAGNFPRNIGCTG